MLSELHMALAVPSYDAHLRNLRGERREDIVVWTRLELGWDVGGGVSFPTSPVTTTPAPIADAHSSQLKPTLNTTQTPARLRWPHRM